MPTTSPTTIDVIELLAGRLTAAQIASKHGVTEREVLVWRAAYVDGLRHAASVPSRKGAAWVVGVSLLLVGVVGASRTALAQSGCTQTLPAPLITFCADAPAHASQVNANFGQLVTWVQQKVGTVGSADVTMTGALNLGGALTVGGAVSAPRYVLPYSNWNSGTPGAGGAAIVNDNVAFDALMIAGNEVASPGTRKINLYDDVFVNRNLAVQGTLSAASVTSATVVPGTVLGGGSSFCNGSSSTLRSCGRFGVGTCGAGCGAITCTRGTATSIAQGACYNPTDGHGGYCYHVLCIQ